MSDRPDIAALEAELRELEERRVALLQSESRRLHGEHAISGERGWFGAFFRWAWPVVEPNAELVWTPLLQLVCSEWERFLDGEVRRICVRVPPGTGKSMATGTMGPAAEMLLRPWTRLYYTSGTSKVLSENSLRCRRILLDPDYHALADRAAALHGFDPWRLAKGEQEKLDYSNDPHRGSRFGRPFHGNTTGPRGHRVVGDDCQQAADFVGTAQQIENRTERDWRIWSQAFFSRLNDRRTGGIGYIAQNLGVGDIPSRWQAADPDLHVVCLPVRYEPEHPDRHPDDWRTEPGELLDPVRLPEDVLERERRTHTIASWSAQYQQRPIPEGGRMIDDADFRTYTHEPVVTSSQLFRLLTCDLTFRDGPGSDCVAVLGAELRGADRYWMDGMIGQADIVKSMAWIREMDRRLQPHAILVELAANGHGVVRLLQDEFGHKLRGIKLTGDPKPARLAVLAVSMKNGRHHFPELRYAHAWLPTLKQHAANAPHGKPVDGVDAMAQAEIWAQANPWAGKVGAGDVGVW